MGGQPDHIRIRLFGGFAVTVGDQTLIDASWNRSRAKALVKLLALQPRRTLHREQVIEALWPSADPSSAQNQLHKNLHYLRQRLNDATSSELLRMAGPLVQLDPGVTVDVAEFRNAAAAALRPGGEGLQQALAVYAGDLLPEDLYEPWTEPHREDLRALRQRLAMELARRYIAEQRSSEACDILHGMLAVEPAYEEAHRALMRAYAAAGERERALRQYDACAAALQALGVQPDHQTHELRDEIERLRTRESDTPIAMRDRAVVIKDAITRDGVRLAYWKMGQGIPLIQLPMGGMSHIARECELPLMRIWYQGLARRHEVIRYDMRGYGSSDRDPTRISPTSALLDLEAVCEAVGTDPVVLFATLGQGRTAISYAARHADRVAGLILWCSDHPRSDHEFGHDKELILGDLKYRDWTAFVNAWAQSLWGWSRAEHARIWAKILRDGASAASLDAFRASEAGRDVTAEMPRVTSPTLVVSRTSFKGSEDAAAAIAAGIPHARLLALDGAYAPWTDASNVQPALRIVDDFCALLGDARPTYFPSAAGSA